MRFLTGHMCPLPYPVQRITGPRKARLTGSLMGHRAAWKGDAMMEIQSKHILVAVFAVLLAAVGLIALPGLI